MRATQLARELSKHFETTLVARLEDFSLDAGLPAASIGSQEASDAISAADWLLGQPTRQFFAAKKRGQRVAFDLFDPLVLELAELYGTRPRIRQRIHRFMEERRLRRALRSGQLLIAATPQQVSYYRTIQAESSFITVPFGAEEAPPIGMAHREPPLILWSGGIWAWLDPLLAIEAVEEVNRRGVACSLTFLGGRRPSGSGPHLRFSEKVRSIAENKPFVDWYASWVPYEERWEWLERAKVVIMLHRRTPEAEASIRTRMFDAMAAGVPVVTSAGGFAADLTRQRGLGIVVEPGDRESVVEAILRLLSDDAFYRSSVSGMREAAEDFRWPKVVAPLVEALRSKK